MSANFGRNYPTVTRLGRADERERLFFFAAAGLAAFLFFTVIFVLNFRDRVNAKQEITPAVNNAPASASLGTITLLGPEKAVKAGAKLSEVRLKEIYWPRNQVPNEAVRDVAELRDQYAKVDLAAGMPLQREHLTKERMGGVTLPLTPGNRAVSIEVDATSGIEGWAGPGTKVDVVLTYLNEGNLVSKIIVQKARVLSLGGDATRPENEIAPRVRNVREPKKTITLDVAPQDALTIITSREMGRLSLMMRAPEDEKSPQREEIEREDIISPGRDKKAVKQACNNGSMRIDGKEYVVGCDGSMSELDSLDP